MTSTSGLFLKLKFSLEADEWSPPHLEMLNSLKDNTRHQTTPATAADLRTVYACCIYTPHVFPGIPGELMSVGEHRGIRHEGEASAQTQRSSLLCQSQSISY